MALIDTVLEISRANRVVDLERIESKQIIPGDFQGSATGHWVKLDENGAGIVRYNNKNYVTKPLGFTSIRAGTAVQLTHAQGVYYSQW